MPRQRPAAQSNIGPLTYRSPTAKTNRKQMPNSNDDCSPASAQAIDTSGGLVWPSGTARKSVAQCSIHPTY
jgi:hypothetical protein